MKSYPLGTKFQLKDDKSKTYTIVESYSGHYGGEETTHYETACASFHGCSSWTHNWLEVNAIVTTTDNIIGGKLL